MNTVDDVSSIPNQLMRTVVRTLADQHCECTENVLSTMCISWDVYGFDSEPNTRTENVDNKPLLGLQGTSSFTLEQCTSLNLKITYHCKLSINRAERMSIYIIYNHNPMV